MPWHKPQLRLAHLMALVAIVGLEFAILPRPASTGAAALTVVTALLVSLSDRVTKLEWAVLVLFHAVLIAVLLPATASSGLHHNIRRRPPIAGPTSPP